MEEARWLEGLLPEALRDRDLLVVFPSQAVADAWALAGPGRFGLGALETDRLIGWDRYKETELTQARGERPSNELARLLWAADFLDRHRRRRVLERLAGPGEPSPAFVRFFATLPPALDRVARLVEAGTSQDPGLEDYRRLRGDYGAFLAAHSLFEPAWADSQRSPTRRALIVAPELMEDYTDYEALLAASPRVSLAHLPPGSNGGASTPPPPLLRFETSYEELRWTFLTIGRLLDAGRSADDIVVSLGDAEGLGAYAQRAAVQAGVPAILKGGRPLADSPYGRFLKEVSAIAASAFAFESLRDLLLDRFLRWKEGAAAADLLRFGADYHAFASYTEAGRVVDIWEASFEAVGGHRDLAAWYRRLKAAILAVSGASSFGGLRKALFAFRRDFLDESSWGAEEARISRVMAELEGLVRAEADLGLAVPSSPLDLLLGSLATRTYVAQGGAGGGNVAILPYRLGALHPARYHFVVGASQEGARVSYRSLPFLSADQREALGQADLDASGHFLRAYAAAGSGVVFSYAVEAPGGWAVPHPHFSGPAASEARPPADLEALRDSSPDRAEARAWREGGGLPGALLTSQLEAHRAAPYLGDGEESYAKRKASAPALAALGPLVRTGEGRLRLSASSLHAYLACPFAWLLSRALRLEEEPTGVGFFDARLAGTMAHEALQALLGGIGALGPLSASRREAYLSLVDGAVDGVLPAFEAAEGPFLKPMYTAYAPLLKDRLRRLVLALVEESGSEAGDLEVTLTKDYPDGGFLLEGRIDRLGVLAGAGTGGGRRRLIVDYKKRALPAKEDLSSTARDTPGEDGGPGSLGDYQLAAYIALCLEAGHEVGGAAYWSIEDARALAVVGDEGALRPTGDWEPELAALDAALEATAAGIEGGSFTMAPPSSGACEACPWKSICRARYATE